MSGVSSGRGISRGIGGGGSFGRIGMSGGRGLGGSGWGTTMGARASVALVRRLPQPVEEVLEALPRPGVGEQQ